MLGGGGGTSRHYTFNQAGAQEIVLQTAGQSAEAETGGILLNMVPRDGGNIFKGSLESDYTNGSLQGGQSLGRAEGPWRSRFAHNQEDLCRLKRTWRPAQEGRALVLHQQRPVERRIDNPGELLQQGPGHVVLRTRLEPAGLHRVSRAGTRDPGHVAGG